MEQKTNTIGIDENLNYLGIIKLFRIGLFAAVIIYGNFTAQIVNTVPANAIQGAVSGIA